MVKWKNIRILTTDITKYLSVSEDYAPEINNVDNVLSANQIKNNWRFLWNGKTSEGWRGAKLDRFPKQGWIIENNILTVLANDGSESSNGGDIVTVEKFSNFELDLDFKISKGANSGIKYFVDTNLNQGEGSSIGTMQIGAESPVSLETPTHRRGACSNQESPMFGRPSARATPVNNHHINNSD